MKRGLLRISSGGEGLNGIEVRELGRVIRLRDTFERGHCFDEVRLAERCEAAVIELRENGRA